MPTRGGKTCCAVKILELTFYAKKCAKNAIKQVIFFYFVRLRHTHKNSVCSTSFALKCLNFTQILLLCFLNDRLV